MKVVAPKWAVHSAVLAGLQSLRSQPVLLAAWTVFWFVGDGLEKAAGYLLLGPVDQYERLQNLSAPAAAVLPFWAAGLEILPISAVVYAVGFAAICRSVVGFRPGELSYVRLGGAELRIGFALLAFAIALSALPWVLDGVLVVLSDILLALPVADLQTSGMNVYASILAGVLVLILLPIVAVFAKLWPLPADVIQRRGLHWKSILASTAGRNGRLLGTFVAALTLSVVIDLVGDLIAEVTLSPSHSLAKALTAIWASSDERPSPYEMKTWLALAIGAPFSAISWAVLVAPGAYIARTGAFDPADVF